MVVADYAADERRVRAHNEGQDGDGRDRIFRAALAGLSVRPFRNTVAFRGKLRSRQPSWHEAPGTTVIMDISEPGGGGRRRWLSRGRPWDYVPRHIIPDPRPWLTTMRPEPKRTERRISRAGRYQRS